MNKEGAIVYAVIVIISYLYAFRKDKFRAKKGLKKGWKQLLKQVPFIFSIFLLVGLFDIFIPKSAVMAIIGRSEGFLSIVNAALLGSIVGGPVSSVYPLGAILLKKGASLSVAAVFMNAWVMVGVISMPYEISIFGKRFVLVRNILAFTGAIIIGIMTGFILTGRII